MVFKILATIAIVGWIVGNFGWYSVRDPWSTGTFSAGEWIFGGLIVLATLSGVGALVALIWGI